MDCYSCRSNSGEQRISPGPTIYEGEHWLVEHAYPVGMLGWLVIVLKAHATALHELTGREYAELGTLLERSAAALLLVTDCEKEYVACFGEAEHFNHVHFHVVAREPDLPNELQGTGIFAMLKVRPEDAVPGDEVKAFCEQMQSYFF